MRNNLRELRIERKWEVKDIAKLLNISSSHYYKIESGIRNPNFVLAGEIAKLLNTTVDYLFFND